MHSEREAAFMSDDQSQALSSGWRIGVGFVLIIGFTILVMLSVRAYDDGPPVPKAVVNAAGETLLTGDDIRAGQRVFLKYGLMENGSIWGHGAYLGPDFSAQYLHTLAQDTRAYLALKTYGTDLKELDAGRRDSLNTDVERLLKKNRYDPKTRTLLFTEPEETSYKHQIQMWTRHFSEESVNGGLPVHYIKSARDMTYLTAFFAWTAWASVVDRPGRSFSYTSNFPYEPLVGNRAPHAALLWSALSLITLLGGTALILFLFGKFDYLGWKRDTPMLEPRMLPGEATESQRATIKYFAIVALLFLAQVLIGGATAHNRAEPGSFYGFNLYGLLPTTVLRTWHLQLAIFWIATAFIAGGLMLAASMGKREPKGQVGGIHFLFWALVVLVVGSLLGELFGVRQMLGSLWSWFGDQGWEYLDLGRFWQILLVVGLLVWMVLLVRFVKPAYEDPEGRELTTLFTIAAGVIPLFYLPAFFFDSNSNFTVVDTWRFWIIHLWVEGFFELFVTTMVAVTFFQLGLVSRKSATRVVYLDAILFLGSGVVGTGHHWYWTGQSHINMAFSALFSAMEVVPLTLLTLDAWDFIKLTRGEEGEAAPHKWAFYFLMAVGFWNFVGAGIFGFLINTPIVSYYEVGTLLTPNHGHAALMGVFGMEAVALMVLGFRQVLTDEQWVRPEKFIRISFWGLNLGLVMMIVGNLFPGGVLQLYDVLQNGYWHARSAAYLDQNLVRTIEWFRLPGDVVFIVVGVVPLVIAALMAYAAGRKGPVAS
jgi:nitric oxide reductase subunit B